MASGNHRRLSGHPRNRPHAHASRQPSRPGMDLPSPHDPPANRQGPANRSRRHLRPPRSGTLDRSRRTRDRRIAQPQFANIQGRGAACCAPACPAVNPSTDRFPATPRRIVAQPLLAVLPGFLRVLCVLALKAVAFPCASDDATSIVILSAAHLPQAARRISLPPFSVSSAFPLCTLC